MSTALGILFWLSLTALAVYLARNKKVGFFWTVLIAIILSPIVAIIVAIVSKKVEAAPQAAPTDAAEHTDELYSEKQKLEDAYRRGDITYAEYEELRRRIASL